MRITLDGESFDLTAELVHLRLAGHDPEGITEYWVEIDGRRWPVKQVIALATGAQRGRFQSQDSRRWLKNLQFPIGSGGSLTTDGTVSRPRTYTPRRSFDASQLEEIEVLDVRVGFSWLHAGSVTLDGEGLPLFPPLPRLPGLYRYDFGVGNDGVRTLYIGESVNLARRGSNYRNAKSDSTRQRTSRRIHKEIVRHLGDGGRVDFAIATSAHWQDGEEIGLHRTSARRLAENAAVLLGQTEPGVRVLNIDAELEGEEPTDD